MLFNASDSIFNKKINSEIKIESATILSLMNDFRNMSKNFLLTGGVHSAAIADPENIIIFREDIGRHNAIDKIIGHVVLSNKSFNKKIIITSGRISSEILLKVLKCEIPVIVSKSAPTNRAIEICRETGITLIGFARGNRMNIYSGEQRIIF